MLEFLKQQFGNQFLSGGVVLMLTGSVLALLRAVPARVLAWAKRRVTIQVEVLNADPLFDYVTFWLNHQPYSKRSRKLTATSTNSIFDSNADDDNIPTLGADKRLKVLLSPAPGLHIFAYGRNVIWLDRTREDGPSGSSKITSLIKRETYTVTMLGKNQTVIRRLLDEIVEFGSRQSDAIRLFTSSFSYWRSTGVIAPRKLDTVVLPDGIAESVLTDARKFLAAQDWYRSVGIPWHRGYLFYGVPGSGKTSLVSALAGELRMDLYLMNISGTGMDDENLSRLMSEVKPGSLVLLEDVDCTAPTRAKESKGVTLSGLLNCLDGVQSREGCMIFMTTNDRTALDAALLRPGRVDMEVEFGFAADAQILRLKDRLAPDRDDRATLLACRGMTMAEAQQFLLTPCAKFAHAGPIA